MFDRGSGVLTHITSLPSNFGIGDLGPNAYKYCDLLSIAKQSYWQILPLNPTDSIYGNSPYSSISAFANNTLLISPALLVKDGWISKGDLKKTPTFPEDYVDYDGVVKYKEQLFDAVYGKFKISRKDESLFNDYCNANASWLDDFALFVILKSCFKEDDWNSWPDGIKNRKKDEIEKYQNEYSDGIEKVKLLQFIFMQQWVALKSYCNQKGIKIIGDIPIYVSYDSVDVWENPTIFKLDNDKKSTVVAGVPPDYFSETGQRWGNPVYDWDKLRETKYQWWIKRIERNLELFDCIRIDHFRGMVEFWEIPVTEETAIKGEWGRVPTDDFFNALRDYFKELPIIAEDLGIITDDVKEAMRRLGFPGMKVLVFAFNGNLDDQPYLPHNYSENSVVYTGTHDNNTVLGWYENEASDQEKSNLNNYLSKDVKKTTVCWDLIELALKSRSKIAIFPIQDILNLGQNSRMNVPGTANDNWKWRCSMSKIKPATMQKLADIVVETQR